MLFFDASTKLSNYKTKLPMDKERDVALQRLESLKTSSKPRVRYPTRKGVDS